jgi:hypothetical protein
VTAPVEPGQSGLSAAQLAALLTLVQAQAAARARITRTAVQAAVAAFSGIRNWWDTDQVSRAVATALRVVQPAQRNAARTTDAYLARVVSTMTGKTVRPAGAVDVAKLRRTIPDQVRRELERDKVRPGMVVLGDTHDGPGADIDKELRLVIPEPLALRPVDRRHAQVLEPGEAYGRVAEHARWQVVAEGKSIDAATEKAMLQVAIVTETDVTAAVREQVRKSLGKVKDVRGYRRILHPELSQHGPCGLCVVAADRVYHVEHLLPIHGRCVCETLPIIGDMDPGIDLNADDLRSLYAAAGGTGAKGLKKVRVAVTEHGELGPVLVDADQKFRGPAQVAKAKAFDPKVAARAELNALDERLGQLKRRQLTGEDLDRPIAWQTNRIAELRKVLAGAA